MLTIPAYAEIEGITIFRDDEDPSHFYYLPRRPRLAQDAAGDPQFTFLRYQFPIERESAEPGGGYLVFTTIMREDADVLDRLQRVLQNRLRNELPPTEVIPEVRVTPVDFTGGSVRLIIMQDNRFVRSIELGRPSLFGDNSASVAVELSADGATLFYEALRREGSIAAIEYNLTFPVRLPAITILGHVDCREVVKTVKAYSLETVKTPGTWGSREDTQTVTTSVPQIMESQGLISLEIMTGSVDVDEDEMESLRSFAFRAMEGFINEHFLKGGSARCEAERRDLLLHFQDADPDTITGSFDLNVSYRDVIDRQYNPSAHLGSDFLGTPVENLVHDIDLGNAPWYFNNLDVLVDTNLDFEKYGDIVHSVVGHFTYDQTGPDGVRHTRRESLVFTEGDRTAKRFRTRLAAPEKDLYQVSVEVNYREGPTPQLVVDSFSTTLRNLTLNVPNPGIIEVQFSTAPEAFGDRLQSIEAEIAYGDPDSGVPMVTDTVILTSEERVRDYRRVIHAQWDKPYRYRFTYNLIDEGGAVQRSTTPWVEASSAQRYVNIPTPFDQVFSLNIIPQVDWSEVREVVVDLEYHDVDSDYRMERTISFSQDTSRANAWRFLLRNPAHREFRYRETYLMSNYAIEEKEWQTRSQDGAVSIGNAPYGVATVSVDPEDIDFEHEVRRVIVRLRYLDDHDPENPTEDTATLLFRGQGAQEWWVTLGKVQDTYEYDVTYVMEDNSQRVLLDQEERLDRSGGSFLFLPAPPPASE